MTNEEAQHAFEFLTRLSQSAGLNWVLDQVEEQLAVGKVVIVKKKASDFKDVSRVAAYLDVEYGESASRTAKPQGAEFLKSEEYSPKERLSILVDALSTAVPRLNATVAAVLSELASFEVDAFEFTSENNVRTPFTIDRSSFQDAFEASRRLESLLLELQQEIKQ